ncbi:MAG TPA: DUF1284 domain-containing protein [Methanobacterium sp.]|nr:DUF1284 domain-containing protein [Methanobacterium sp.]
MKIRAHHLLCMQGFQGYGYSEEFSQNMSKIIQNLKSNKEQKIEITVDLDVICKCCPHKKNKICKNIISNWMIKRVDKKVIGKLKIDYSTEISFKEIISLTNHVFKTHDDLKGICSSCLWKEKCLWYTSKTKTQN